MEVHAIMSSTVGSAWVLLPVAITLPSRIFLVRGSVIFDLESFWKCNVEGHSFEKRLLELHAKSMWLARTFWMRIRFFNCGLEQDAG